jgi:drug/metabolite transporter superfamily protein YnfA
MKILEFYQKMKIVVSSAIFLLVTGVLLNVTAYYLQGNAYLAYGTLILVFWLCIVWYRMLHKLHRKLMVIRYKQSKMSE